MYVIGSCAMKVGLFAKVSSATFSLSFNFLKFGFSGKFQLCDIGLVVYVVG